MAKAKGISIALVQEPYVGASGVLKQNPGTQVIQCTLNRQTPVKAAIIVFGDRLEVIHDPQLVTETEVAVLLVAGHLKLGVVSVYLDGKEDIEPYLDRIKAASGKLPTKNILVGGDVNAWSHWWGSRTENARGEAYNTLLNEMELQILNTGDIPTFEEYRGDRLYTSCVDVTACSLSLLDKVENWTVNRDLTTSDHNAITFEVRLKGRLQPLKPITTRRYNTKKAKWKDFETLFRTKLAENNITPDTIRNIMSGRDLEAMIDAYTDIIHKTCDELIPKIGARRETSLPPWWCKELENLKKDVLRKKRRIKNAAPSRIKAVIKEYQDARVTYAERANEAETKSWKEFCTTQDGESLWDGIYRVIRKTARRQEDMLLRGADGQTLNPVQSANLLAETFYPDDSVSTDSPHHTLIRELTQDKQPEEIEGLSDDDPPFQWAELELVLRSLNSKKAPGMDGLTADICTKAIHSEREVFTTIANKCLSLAHFPKQWKIAHVVILRKPGKEDYTHPKSYRPIGLLSVLGKIVEKLLICRLQWHILPTLSPKQYGFMPQRGTEDALYDLLGHIRSEVNNKKIVIIVSLDIEGAFDNAWWPALKHQLITKKCPKNLYAVINSYLSDRKIVVNYARATSERCTTKGCVQGSIGGPTFWNIILDPLLQKLSGEEVYCQAFADDGVIVFSGHEVSALEESANSVLETVANWGKMNKLNFAAHKTNVMLITKKLRYDPPVIHMSGCRLNLVDEVKLLGLIIDRKLNFLPHVNSTCRKVSGIYKQLACAAKVTWGLNTEIIRTIYVAVIEPIVMYASSAWYKSTELQMIRDRLEALQRGFAQKICKAYRTVSLTSALALSGTLPLDLRIQEAASLYMAKKGLSTDYIPPGRELEKNVSYLDQPHPSTLETTEYELLEDMNQETLNSHQITGPQIYTDGSKIEGKVGAALTWWEDGQESCFSTFSLDPSCTVFQSELYALFRAVQSAKSSKAKTVNILSDSRSSLDLLANPRLTHPLTKTIKECISGMKAEGRQVRLFWLRAHVGTAGNERADELAKSAALHATSTMDYGKIPLSYVKRKIREETVRRWQDRYDSSSTGGVTKLFLPDVNKAYRIVRTTKLTPTQVQVLTGHGGIAEYLHRFRLLESPGCECDPTISETIWHVVLECPRFLAAKYELETQIDSNVTRENLSTIIADPRSRTHFLNYAEKVFTIAAKRHRTLTPTRPTPITIPPNTSTITDNPPDERRAPQHRTPIHRLLELGERGEPGISIRGVALFMDNNTERLGISYCNVNAKNRVAISPGLANLLNGSTTKTTMKWNRYKELALTTIAGCQCRLVRSQNKTIVLIDKDTRTPFSLANAVLSKIGQAVNEEALTPRIISVDAMVVEYERGEVGDHIGCIKASAHHHVVAYEDRGEDLSYLKAPTPTTTPNTSENLHSLSITQTGSKRLQEKVQAGKTIARKRADRGAAAGQAGRKRALTNIISAVFQSKKDKVSRIAERQAAAVRDFTSPRSEPEKTKHPKRTRADKGEVSPPSFIPPTKPTDNATNALLEFLAIEKATREVNLKTCKNILQAYRWENEGLLNVQLVEAEAAIYDNDKSQIIKGKMSGQYMAAFSSTGGFVPLNERETQRTGKLTFLTPPNDPIVVTARCTKIMLQEKILEMAKTISGPHEPAAGSEPWTMPNVTWINGVPGCGKTSWIVDKFDADNDIIITTTTEAAKDLRGKVAQRIGDGVKSKVRTMASVLANGFMERSEKRLLIDEALMNHFGAIVMASRLLGAEEVVIVGDVNQLPYVERENLFDIRYSSPAILASISQEMFCTHRNPMDVAYALSEVYPGMYSSRSRIRSLKLKRYTGANIPTDPPQTLFLVLTQEEKTSLISKGYGSGTGSCTLTVHEAQGLNYESVIIVQTRERSTKLRNSVPHAVVAVSRHTASCTYYTDDSSDAIGRFVRRATEASERHIIDHNTKMAIKNRDEEIVKSLLNTPRPAESEAGTSGQ